jgi:Domain of unknown function (DUF3644)
LESTVAAKARKALENWEIALIKAMIVAKRWNDQDILAYFTRPTRSINHARISAIRNRTKHAGIKAAASEELASFLATWPDIDPSTGLSLRGDELLLKAREAMIAAVHVFNGAGLTFRGELFIVTAIIAWTYLLHAWLKKQGVDYRYMVNVNGRKVVAKTANGEDKYWELGHCLKHAKCPLEKGMINNLTFLLELRHEIEHRTTTRIDDVTGPKLQACCINFNDTIKQLFGPQYGLERRLPIALQFVTFGPDQRAILKKASTLPRHIEIMMDNFDKHLTPEELADPRFRFQVAFVQRTANRPSSADEAIEFVVAGTEEAKEIDRILLKEVEKKKYLPNEIVKIMKAEGFPKFNMHQHTLLWKKLDAKKKEKGYGAVALARGVGMRAGWRACARNAIAIRSGTSR